MSCSIKTVSLFSFLNSFQKLGINNRRPGVSTGILYIMSLLLPGTQIYAAGGSVNTLEQQTIEVVGTTPLSTSGIQTDKYAGNIQSLTATDFENENPLNLSEILVNNFSSISVNTVQNNPYQNDIFYRGFLASPLVGSAIGLSSYIDGVRINEGFGDILNWDLIPQPALSVVHLIPGSNPLYGLNTLGGALSMRTKSGRIYQGTELETTGGSWGRWGVVLEHGNHYNNFDWYLMINKAKEDGWRVHSPSDVEQFFSKLGWEDDRTDIDLSYTYAKNELTGNGFVPERTFALDDKAVHTYPDFTGNEMYFVNLTGIHKITAAWQVSGNTFYRKYSRTTLNGDAELECVAKQDRDGENEEGDKVFTDDEAENRLVASRCTGTVDSAGLYDEDGNQLASDLALVRETEGEDRTTDTDTDNWGGAIQTTFTSKLLDRDNQLTVGLTYSHSDTRFTQKEVESELFRSGNSWGTRREADEEFETEVDIDTEQRNIGILFTDTITIIDDIALTVAGRWQKVNTEIHDRTGEEENNDLNGSHDFNRFNPMTGLNYTGLPNTTLFINYSEGFRVPTPSELSCADPDDPCSLPNAFVADPPLDPIIAKTYEIGGRGQVPGIDSLFWGAALFRTDLKDDLLFTVTEIGGAGFFQNVEKTRRQGAELSIRGLAGSLNYFINYAFIDATFQSEETLASVVDTGGVSVESGDKIPAIPQHNVRLGGEYELMPNVFWLGGELIAASGSYLRGDEGNKLPKTSFYTVFNLHGRLNIGQHVQLWGRINNVFDREYETAGIRNFNAHASEMFNTDIVEERFIAPGAPRAAWIGVKLFF